MIDLIEKVLRFGQPPRPPNMLLSWALGFSMFQPWSYGWVYRKHRTHMNALQYYSTIVEPCWDASKFSTPSSFPQLQRSKTGGPNCCQTTCKSTRRLAGELPMSVLAARLAFHKKSSSPVSNEAQWYLTCLSSFSLPRKSPPQVWKHFPHISVSVSLSVCFKMFVLVFIRFRWFYCFTTVSVFHWWLSSSTWPKLGELLEYSSTAGLCGSDLQLWVVLDQGRLAICKRIFPFVWKKIQPPSNFF